MKKLLLTLPLLLVLGGCIKSPEVKHESTPETLASGLKVYTQYCAGCHQEDGYGVTGMQPALVDDSVVAGDPDLLIRVILKGPAAVLPANRPHFANTMPAFDRIPDDQLADLLTYLRHQYGHDASAVEAAHVKEIRTQP